MSDNKHIHEEHEVENKILDNKHILEINPRS